MGSLQGEWLCWARRRLPGEATTTLHRVESAKIKTSLQKAEKLVAVEENGREERKREKRKRGKRKRGKGIKGKRGKEANRERGICRQRAVLPLHPKSNFTQDQARAKRVGFFQYQTSSVGYRKKCQVAGGYRVSIGPSPRPSLTLEGWICKLSIVHIFHLS